METSFSLISQRHPFNYSLDNSQEFFSLFSESDETFQNRLEDVRSQNMERAKIAEKKKKEDHAEERKALAWNDQMVAQSYATGNLRYRDIREQIKKAAKDKANTTFLSLKENKNEKEISNVKNQKQQGTEQKEENKNSTTVIKAIVVDPKESKKALQSLHNFSQMTQLQKPDFNKVSIKLMSIIKGAEVNKGAKQNRNNNTASNTSDASKNTKEMKTNPKTLTSRAHEYAEKMKALKSKMMQQVRFHLKMAIQKGVGNIHINLKPQFLGNMKINLVMTESATATQANFLVENNTVKEVLEESEKALRDAFKERNIELESFDVELAEDFDENTGNGRAFSSFEDREATKAWVNSFYRYDDDITIVKPSEEDSEDNEIIYMESDDALDVIA